MKSTHSALFLSVLLSAQIPGAANAQSVTGTGQTATALFPLAQGLAVFEMEHRGDGPFIVRLLTDSGHVVDTLARGNGLFRGAKATHVPVAGMYLYDVAAGGRWSVRVRPAGAVPGEEDAEYAERMREAATAGEREARKKGSGRWMLGGLGGGALLGPLGAGGVFLAANRPAPPLTPELQQSLSGKDPEYVRVFTEAYQARRRSSRKASALVGGAVGTIVFTFAVIQIARWNDTGGGAGNGGGDLP